MESAKESVEYAKLIEVQGLDEYTGFPVYVAIGGNKINTNEIDSPIAYVLAGKGVFLYSNSGIFETLTLSDVGIAGLSESNAQCLMNLRRIPKNLVMQVLGFFHWAYKEHSSEAIVLPYYNSANNTWRIVVPEQTVTRGHCDYTVPNPNDVPEGYDRIGSWHSHGDMSAFHSGVDTHDEFEGDDGLHMTSGDFTKTQASQKPSIVASIAAHGTRFTLHPSQIFTLDIEQKDIPATVKWQGSERVALAKRTEFFMKLEAKESLDFPEEWKNRVTAAKVQIQSSSSGNFQSWNNRTKLSSACYDCSFFLSSHTISEIEEVLSFLNSPEGAETKEKVIALKKYIHPTDIKYQPEFKDLLKEISDTLEASLQQPNFKHEFSPKTLVIIHRYLMYKKARKNIDEVIRKSKNTPLSIGDRYCLNRKSRHHKLNKTFSAAVPLPTSSNEAHKCRAYDASPGYTISRVEDNLKDSRATYEKARKEWVEDQNNEQDTKNTGSTRYALGVQDTCATCGHFWDIIDMGSTDANCELADKWLSAKAAGSSTMLEDAEWEDACGSYKDYTSIDDEDDYKCDSCGVEVTSYVITNGRTYCYPCYDKFSTTKPH